MRKIKFNLRSFTSFSLVLSTIIMSWSGFILYVAPPGRIANSSLSLLENEKVT